MLNSSNPYPETLIYRGMVMVHYNTAALPRAAEISGGFGQTPLSKAEEASQRGIEVLG